MGISGLLPIVSRIIKARHINHYKGHRIGIDGHVWMHHVACMFAEDLFHDPTTEKYVPPFIKKVEALISKGITPIVIFDGNPAPYKSETREERRATRDKHRADAEYYLGINNRAKAIDCMRGCINIEKHMVHAVMKALMALGVEAIISPYEADAQLCFLERIGYIDYVMTIDSDLIVFGCNRILYKFDGTHVDEYHSSRLKDCKDEFFANNLLDIAILSGCDYLKSIKGVGINIAYKKLKELGTVEAFVNHMRAAGKSVPMDYLERFKMAKDAFRHHIVYNPLTGARTHLGGEMEECLFLGSLEDEPFVVENHLGEDIAVARHFKPGLALTAPIPVHSVEAERSPKEAKEDVTVEVDRNLVSPYFL